MNIDSIKRSLAALSRRIECPLSLVKLPEGWVVQMGAVDLFPPAGKAYVAAWVDGFHAALTFRSGNVTL